MVAIHLEFFIDIAADFWIFKKEIKVSRDIDGSMLLEFMKSLNICKSLPNN